MTSYDMALLLLLCICDFSAVCTQQLAFQKDSSGFVSMIGYTSIVYGFATDFFIFDVSVNFYQAIASAVIIMVNLATTYKKLKSKQ